MRRLGAARNASSAPEASIAKIGKRATGRSTSRVPWRERASEPSAVASRSSSPPEREAAK